MFKCVQCFIEFWKDFHADQKWKFPELPPSQFKKRLELNRPGVELSEFERAKWFWRRRPNLILGKGLRSYLLVVLIPIFILSGITYRIYGRIDKQSISPLPAVHFFEAAAVVILLLLICIRLWFDMAQVIAVAEDERRMHKALRRAAGLLRHNFGSLFWLYFRVSLIAWIVFAVGVHIWMEHLRPESILAPFLLSQFLIIFWQGCRLWQRASECIWYREHQRAIAVATQAYEPTPVTPTPAFSQ